MTDPAVAINRLLEIMATLRSAQGCPWDREQTPESLKPYLIEETFEVLEAIEQGDPAAICEELGDLLLQVVFQAQIFAEQSDFDFADIAAAISTKLIRRHPHVFSDEDHGGSDLHWRRWEAIKVEEKRASGRRTSLFGGIPRALPPLQRAGKLIDKSARAGFDWPGVGASRTQVERSHAELQQAFDTDDREARHTALGNHLFDLMVLAHSAQLDAERAMQCAIDRMQQFLEASETAAGLPGGCRTPEPPGK